MSARRQPSTTSLSKYMRAGSPANTGRSTDFCNSFWGAGDGGVDVLFARMRGAMRTMDELRNFWKERAVIEEDYAKRLAKLAKGTLGRDEIGELRSCLDTIRLETDRQSGYHLTLAQQIKSDLEAQTTAFYNKQTHHKKVYQSVIEKEFKAKQTQESYVTKAREKYEQDCMRINSYTAQSTLVQGKDLEKVQLKLERAQQTVQANERDFANFARAFQDTAAKWEQDWKTFCDTCQDLEDDRIEFMKDNMWAYANAVSTVCVADDESCEKLRVALEQMDSEKEMENFVRDYGTGNQIPAPPAFFTYNSPEVTSPSARSKPAHFLRSSQRSSPLRQTQAIPPEDDEEPPVNTAGIGAGGGSHSAKNSISDATQINKIANAFNGINGHHSPTPSNAGSSSAQQITRKPTTVSSYRNPPPSDPLAETIDPTAETYIKVGSNAYKVDLNDNPQHRSTSSFSGASSASPTKHNSADDPLAKQLEELKNQVSATGNVRRNSTWRGRQSGDASSTGASAASRRGTIDSLAAPGSATGSASGRSPSPSREYSSAAEMVVGGYPASHSRPTSPNPNPPTAAFMVPKKPVSPGAEVIEGVLSDYHQSLPGERKSISRSNSRRGSYSASVSPGANEQQGHNLNRPPSVGHAGIGAHGSRSNSPQPMSRSTSPAPSPGQYISPPSGGAMSQQRPASPNPLGIALDPNGRVMVDEMAQRYQQQQHQQQQQQQQQVQQQQAQYRQPPPQQQHHQYRQGSYSAPAAQPPYAPPPAPYQAPPPPQPSYVQPPPPPIQSYAPPPAHYQAPPPQPMYQPPPPAAAPVGYGHSQIGVNGVQRGMSVGGGVGGGYYVNGVPQVQQPPPQQQQQQQQQQLVQRPPMHPQQNSGYPHQQAVSVYRDAGPVRRSPSPQPPPAMAGAMVAAPTRQVTEDGAGILFYVQALYDYTATIDEEFDFQAGDVIAVTATPEDGWWSGVLLDEDRRQKGRHVFPSNFVRLF